LGTEEGGAGWSEFLFPGSAALFSVCFSFATTLRRFFLLLSAMCFLQQSWFRYRRDKLAAKHGTPDQQYYRHNAVLSYGKIGRAFSEN
jgi:hypothetical protein